MSANRTAAEIAASIDTSTVAGHNLRALLLRMRDGDDDSGFWNERGRTFNPHTCPRLAIAPGVLVEFKRGAKLGGVLVLTPLGREVAELLRPRPWRVDDATLWDFTVSGRGQAWVVVRDGHDLNPMGTHDRKGDAKRIAELLTRDDLDQAKRYRTEPNS